MSSDASKKAANKQSSAANQGIAEQQRQFDTFQQNIQPYLVAGQNSLTGLTNLTNNPDSIQDSAAYQWRLGQGMQALDRSAAARGSLYSGGHSADLMQYGQGLASQEYGDQWNRLMGMTQLGQNSAVGAGSMGMQSANNIGNLLVGSGNAQANGAIGSANAWGNALSGLANVAGQYAASRSSSYSPNPNSAGPTDWGAFAPNNPSSGWQPSGTNTNLLTGGGSRWYVGGN
ncbi:hypothetical protein CSC71_05790 [Pseudoxanthomonas sangjuensis]|nr:hypothetical protein CSC71_05790 [Pseudoxanthomonas sangjuensis]